MTTPYKKRYNEAVALVRQGLALTSLKNQRLYTPVWKGRAYRWFSPMDTDGILYGQRPVATGEDHGGSPGPGKPRSLHVGVILQSEFATSQTKPNPFGKAFVTDVPLGLWVDTVDDERIRLDEAYVLFVVPQATAVNKKKTSENALRNVKVAADVSPNAFYIEVGQGDSAQSMADKIKMTVNGWLRGAGRLPGT